MDVALARTFLEVVARGSFVAAAARLHLTQTAVSARVKSLEEQLGATLFARHKSGAVLTPAGERFVPHATALLQVWERARHQVALPAGCEAMVHLGCEPGLWNPLVLRWLLRMQRQAPRFALRADVRSSRVLLEEIVNGTLDIAILYAPPYRPGLRAELLVEEKLVLVSTDPHARAPDPASYVQVDWGPEFAEQQGLVFPQLARPAIASDFGPLACEVLLAAGGSGYFRRGVVQAHLEAGRLHRIAGAPEFAYPAYAVHAEGGDPALIAPALAALREAAADAGLHAGELTVARNPECGSACDTRPEPSPSCA